MSNLNKNGFLKSIFATRIAKEIKRFSLLINTDVTLFSRSTKSDYSWLEKGKKFTVRNICLSNSDSFIAAISSTDSIYTPASNDTVNEYLFKEFLKKLKDFIKHDKK